MKNYKTIIGTREQMSVDILRMLDGETQPTTVRAMADRLEVSTSYIELLIADLRKQGYVRPYRGPGGGYVLVRDASQINIGMLCRKNRSGSTRSPLFEPVMNALDKLTLRDVA